MIEQGDIKVKPAPKPKVWKLAKGQRADLPSPFGLVKVTNEDLKNPKILAMISQIEVQTGNKLFGTVFVTE